ncbi:hypothetical protein JXA80_02445 [bacterium]|nr:hypothetical protein [candidate division CSSED10-310 bacterium]
MKRMVWERNKIIGYCWIVSILVLAAGFLGCSNESVDIADLLKQDSDVLSMDNVDLAGSKIALKRTLGDETGYDEVYQRSLFNSDRQYYESQSAESPEEPTPTPKRATVDLPDFELVGTLTSSDTRSIAFIKNLKPKDRKARTEVEKFEIGDWLGDYLVSVIEPSKVTLARGEELAYLRLKPPKNVSRKTAGPPRGTTRGGNSPKQGNVGGKACGIGGRPSGVGAARDEREEKEAEMKAAQSAEERSGRESRSRSAAGRSRANPRACGSGVAGTRSSCGR